MLKEVLTYILLFAVVGFAPSAVAVEYYIAPSGSDSSSGSQSQPWKTIQKGANSASAGDIINIAAGTYNEQVTLSRSGSTSGGRITFRGAGIDQTIINASGKSHGITTSGSPDHITVSGLTVQHATKNGVNLIGSSSSWIENITLESIKVFQNGHAGSWDHGIELKYGRRIMMDGIQAIDNATVGVLVITSEYVVIQNSIAQYNNGEGRLGSSHAYEDNADGFNLQNSRWTFGKNISTSYNGEDGWDIGSHPNTQGLHKYSYIRNVVAHDNGPDYNCWNGGKGVTASDGDITSHFSYAQVLSYNNGESGARFYEGVKNGVIANSTFDDSGCAGAHFIQGAHTIEVKNVIGTNNPRGNIDKDSASNMIYDYNIYYDSVINGPHSSDVDELDSHSLTSSPLYKNPNNGDYTLQSSSPAIDSGGPLTLASSCSGNTVHVGNSLYFADGFGMTDGDVIAVGSNRNLLVTEVINDTSIKVDRSITCSNGDWVNYEYSGSAPDRGAFEFGDLLPTNAPSPSTTMPPISPTPVCILGDVDCDGVVGLLDHGAVVTNFGQVGQNILGDVDGDGEVGLLDYGIVVTRFGATE